MLMGLQRSLCRCRYSTSAHAVGVPAGTTMAGSVPADNHAMSASPETVHPRKSRSLSLTTGRGILMCTMTMSHNSPPPSPTQLLLQTQRGLRHVLADVTRVLGLPVDVLMQGESGTGKEFIARLLHEADPQRHDQPFVAINCAALPESLLEADLFGYRRSAFTGADVDRQGLFQQANGGTLFLDEVGELPVSLQPKLLRALQERLVRPVGAAAEQAIDVRIVSATNRQLDGAITAGRFRADLYYRLADFIIDLPPLRQRRQDIPQLAEHFLQLYRRQFDRCHIQHLGPGALSWMRTCDWRGNNVRELSIVLKRAILLCDGPVLTAQHLWAAVAQNQTGDEPPRAIGDERVRLENALQQSGGNLSAAARRLGMKRSTLHDRLRRHGIQRSAHQ